MTTFSDLDLNPKVQKAIAEAGYETPTPIQAGAIPPALAGRDVLGIAQTGTGKTASFTLPMITMLARGRARARMPRSLVLCPTRELAAQVAENFDIYAKHVKLTKALLIGGVSFKEQESAIDKGVDVLIATPGRLLDHFERGKLILNDVKVMVVDEADRMLDMGFIPDIERIFGLVPFTRQTLFFSATMAPEIERITNTFLSNPEKIEVARQSTTSDTIEQRLVHFQPTRRDVAAKQKRDMLRAVIAAEGEACSNAIIFCNRKVDVDIVAKSLKKHGLNAEPIHGDLDQSHRMRTLDGFRDGSIRFLVASDVAARGLDIPNVSHVFNYDLPSHAEDYVHRIGRTGRAGRSGVAVSLSVPTDDKYLTAIERLIETPIPRAEPPVSPGAKGDARPEASADEERRGRRGGRGRNRSDRKDEAPSQTQTQTPAPDTPEAKAPEQPTESDSGRAATGQNETGSRRGGRGRDNRRGGRGDSGGRGPVGMGEFTPDFIALSFDERRGGPARDMVEDAGENEAKAASEVAAEEPKPKRTRRKKKSEDTGVAEVAETGTDAGAEAASDRGPETPIASDADMAPEAPQAETVGDAPAKPKRTRRKKAEPEVDATDAAAPEAEATEAAAEKPKRRRKKKTDEADAAPEAEQEEKPKRTRRKKAQADSPAPEAETPSED